MKLSSGGTWVQLALVLAIVGASVTGVVAFMRTSSLAENGSKGLVRLEGLLADQTKATGDLTRSIIGLQGDVKSLSDGVDFLQTMTTEGSRDTQKHEVQLTKMETDLANMKERVQTYESALKVLEARVLSIEIARGGARGSSIGEEGGK